ncbi:MAG: discoidin domain-containing protein [Bacteroidota bacterium]
MKTNCLVLKLFLLSSFSLTTTVAQSRINYNNQDLFLSGSNVAWVDFAYDVGPGTTNFTAFQNYFSSISNAGGNAIRFWLHTTGTNTPQFDANGFVIGPGQGTISDLKQILDLAWQNNLGMVLSLWSFDMMRNTMSQTYLNRNRLMLTDTLYTRSYIENSLLPMVRELKDHPAIISWEVFNEPEGMSTEFGWPSITTADVDMFYIQRFINLVAGAIHREVPGAKVTNGTWGFPAATDVATIGKISAQDYFSKLTAEQKVELEIFFESKYGVKLNANQIAQNFYNLIAANKNYYRDDRLIEAGGDPLGTLDFYTVHYYDWAGVAMSPFHNPYSYWNLDKELVIAEFYIQDTFNKNDEDLYKILIETGYAGALDWGWDFSIYSDRAKQNMKYLYANYPYDVVLNPKTGEIYSFTASGNVIEKGDTVLLKWKTAIGSNVTLNSLPVDYQGEMIVSPAQTIFYTLQTSGETPSTLTLFVDVLPSGKITYFKINSNAVGPGESTTITWQTSRGSTVTLNDEPVGEDGSAEVYPTGNPTKYKLLAVGEVVDSAVVYVSIVPANQVNRALNKIVTASTAEQDFGHDLPAYAVDGSLGTSWFSENADAQWIEIDLGSEFIVEKINLIWDYGYAKSYRIGISSDMTSYKLVKQNIDGKGGTETFENLNSKGRYLKIMLDKRATQYAFSFKEIEVYGIPNPSDADEIVDELPSQFILEQNYPNPFNPSTTISYIIPTPPSVPPLSKGRDMGGVVTLKVYDILGREVTTLVNEYQRPGKYSVKFDVGANRRFALQSGVYFYTLSISDLSSNTVFQETKKMILIK